MRLGVKFSIVVPKIIWMKWREIRTARGYKNELIVEKALETLKYLPNNYGAKTKNMTAGIEIQKKKLYEEFEVERARVGYSTSEALKNALLEILEEEGYNYYDELLQSDSSI